MSRQASDRLRCLVYSAVALLLSAATVAAAAEDPVAAQTMIQGTIFDILGNPIPGRRVVVHQARGDGVWVGRPSGEDGTYGVEVPRGGTYAIVAAISPEGGRAEVPGGPEVIATGASVLRDLYLHVSSVPGPRHAATEVGGTDRLFLSFVEDPLLADNWRIELRADAEDFDFSNRYTGRLIVAAQLPMLPRIEWGLRAGWQRLDPSAGDAQTGATDLDLWTKFHLFRSADGKLDVAVGGLFTLPTGDEQKGLGNDALQSKLFAAFSRDFDASVLVIQAGARSTEDGVAGVAPLDGKLSAAGGLAVIVPLSSRTSWIVEAAYDGARFEGLDDDARILFGVNWRLHPGGTIRVAIAGGIADAAPDAALTLGYARDF